MKLKWTLVCWWAVKELPTLSLIIIIYRRLIYHDGEIGTVDTSVDAERRARQDIRQAVRTQSLHLHAYAPCHFYRTYTSAFKDVQRLGSHIPWHTALLTSER